MVVVLRALGVGLGLLVGLLGARREDAELFENWPDVVEQDQEEGRQGEEQTRNADHNLFIFIVCHF